MSDPTSTSASTSTSLTHLRPLTAVEARVLATLMEKARTVPDSYPMTQNGIVVGCNQKTSRGTLMNVTDEQATEALDALKLLTLVSESSGGRVARFEHNFQRRLGVPEQSAVLLGLLILRGPLTSAELRLNAERWYKFADTSSVEGFLEELQARSEAKGGPLVTCLPRAPGAREQRWAHLLSGPVENATAFQRFIPQPGDPIEMERKLDALTQEVAQLRHTVAFLVQELGLTVPAAES